MSLIENTILLNQKNADCKEIFQAVCDELGKHYEKLGFKYSRSRPKIVLKKEDLKLEICFWSSKSNISGQSITLEILPNFYSSIIPKTKKTSGFLFGHSAIFNHKYTDNPKKIRVVKIFGEVVEQIDEYSSESVIKESNVCNIYDIDEYKFKKIIEFIDLKILPSFEKLKTEQGLIELTENPTKSKIWSLNGKGGNSDFIEYCKLKFPNVDIEKRLGFNEDYK
ncbi:hypothetical protein [Flavobacterium tyrosinilyticum]|uniref:hypothetical protein n=1 Tax=Flavobacterium tyrosinilyticum TaxID=1658740 RepID=UPI00202DF756|nr:hypothetical protein [Flavobacterium tyrosinilyticum]MCM0665146.1 hypothetical protein [Flavobacterium tyrosinilyticum]